MVKNIIIVGLCLALVTLGVYRMADGHQGVSHSAIIANPNINTPINHGNCDWWNSDLNHDCHHNVGDRGLLQQQFTNHVPTYTVTPTPTETLTPTATFTPTHTPTPGGYTIADLLNDTTGAHDGTLCPDPQPNGVGGFDWQFNGRVKSATSSWPGMTGWGTFQWQTCGGSTAGVTVSVQNLKVYAWNGSAWVQYAGQNNPDNWCNNAEPDTTFLLGDCTDVAGGWAMPEGTTSLHWSEATDTLVSGYQCHVVLFEAKASGGAVMANAGLDWREGSQSRGDSFLGSYRALTANWRQLGGTSCTPALLNANPPPGF